MRPARPADRPALRRLQRHLPEPSPRLLAHGLRTGGVLVSPHGGRPVGYLLAVGTRFDPRNGGGPPEATGRRRPPETDAPLEPSDGRTTGGECPSDPAGSTHLAELVVAPARRREGHASALLDRLFAATDDPVTVAVAPGNAAARALYRAHGFERAERREDYFASGPALWLVRR